MLMKIKHEKEAGSQIIGIRRYWAGDVGVVLKVQECICMGLRLSSPPRTQIFRRPMPANPGFIEFRHMEATPPHSRTSCSQIANKWSRFRGMLPDSGEVELQRII
jgi:hypothetical protein